MMSRLTFWVVANLATIRAPPPAFPGFSPAFPPSSPSECLACLPCYDICQVFPSSPPSFPSPPYPPTLAFPPPSPPFPHSPPPYPSAAPAPPPSPPAASAPSPSSECRILLENNCSPSRDGADLDSPHSPLFPDPGKCAASWINGSVVLTTIELVCKNSTCAVPCNSLSPHFTNVSAYDSILRGCNDCIQPDTCPSTDSYEDCAPQIQEYTRQCCPYSDEVDPNLLMSIDETTVEKILIGESCGVCSPPPLTF